MRIKEVETDKKQVSVKEPVTITFKVEYEADYPYDYLYNYPITTIKE